MRPLASPSITLAAAFLACVAVTGSTSGVPGDVRGVPPEAPRATGTSPGAVPAPTPGFLAPSPTAERASPPQTAPPGDAGPAGGPVPHEFFFTRAAYSGGRGMWGRGRSWATDYPKADRQFLVVVRRITNLDAYPYENAVSLADPALRRFPFLYALEVGYMNLRPEEVEGLRSYLEAGGFLVIDDFWGSREWAAFEAQMNRVLPGRTIEDLPLDHPIFHAFYNIEEVKQVPARGRGVYGRPTYERDGVTPRVRGIFDDDGRLMVVINFNTDLGDAWEWAEDPNYPLEYSTYAYEMGVNMIVYGMSH